MHVASYFDKSDNDRSAHGLSPFYSLGARKEALALRDGKQLGTSSCCVGVLSDVFTFATEEYFAMMDLCAGSLDVLVVNIQICNLDPSLNPIHVSFSWLSEI